MFSLLFSSHCKDFNHPPQAFLLSHVPHQSLAHLHIVACTVFLSTDLWADCLESVGASTSHNPMGLHGLLQGQLYFFFFFTISAISSSFPQNPLPYFTARSKSNRSPHLTHRISRYSGYNSGGSGFEYCYANRLDWRSSLFPSAPEGQCRDKSLRMWRLLAHLLLIITPSFDCEAYRPNLCYWKRIANYEIQRNQFSSQGSIFIFILACSQLKFPNVNNWKNSSKRSTFVVTY
jgi:hypothetical protein